MQIFGLRSNRSALIGEGYVLQVMEAEHKLCPLVASWWNTMSVCTVCVCVCCLLLWEQIKLLIRLLDVRPTVICNISVQQCSFLSGSVVGLRLDASFVFCLIPRNVFYVGAERSRVTQDLTSLCFDKPLISDAQADLQASCFPVGPQGPGSWLILIRPLRSGDRGARPRSYIYLGGCRWEQAEKIWICVWFRGRLQCPNVLPDLMWAAAHSQGEMTKSNHCTWFQWNPIKTWKMHLFPSGSWCCSNKARNSYYHRWCNESLASDWFSACSCFLTCSQTESSYLMAFILKLQVLVSRDGEATPPSGLRLFRERKKTIIIKMCSRNVDESQLII